MKSFNVYCQEKENGSVVYYTVDDCLNKNIAIDFVLQFLDKTQSDFFAIKALENK